MRGRTVIAVLLLFLKSKVAGAEPCPLGFFFQQNKPGLPVMSRCSPANTAAVLGASPGARIGTDRTGAPVHLSTVASSFTAGLHRLGFLHLTASMLCTSIGSLQIISSPKNMAAAFKH